MKLAERILAFVGQHRTASVLDLVNHILVDPLRIRRAVHELAKAGELLRVAGHGDEAIYIVTKLAKPKTPPSREEKKEAMEWLRGQALGGDLRAGVALREWRDLAKECARLRGEAKKQGASRG